MPRVNARVENTDKPIWYRFHNVGDTFTALLLANPEKRRAKDIDGNEKSWSDGSPVFEWVYELLHVSNNEHPDNCHFCNLRDQRDDPEATEARRFAASSKHHKVIQEAVRAAKNDAGQNELYGPVTLTFAKEDKDKQVKGKAAPRVFTASYSIPTDAEVSRVDAFLGVEADFSGLLEDTEVEAPKASKGKKLDMDGLLDILK